MIYIDPPYNTGNDFVYEDDFAENTEEFLQRSNQKDEQGNRLISNSDANGRFHSDWLSMMLPRLKLARNLLRDDGVIFISIDDNEQASLKKLCDEVFGENNFISNLVWQKKFSRSNDATYFSSMHDHILCYCKNNVMTDQSGWRIGLLPRGADIPNGYSNPDNDPRGHWTSVALQAKSGSEKSRYEITTPSGRVCLPPNGRFWSVSYETYLRLLSENRVWFGVGGEGTPRQKTFLSEVQAGLRPNTLFLHTEVGHNQEGKQETKALFDGVGVFDGPKPIRLLRHLSIIANTDSSDVIMDFFAGSATTAHAIMQLNSEDGGNRKFIMVQLPEQVDEKHEAYKVGYKTIAEISKERIRRAGAQILKGECHADWNKDIGFRVLKVDTSNMQGVYYQPQQLSQDDLFASVDNIKPDRTSEDLLFQVLLDWGVDLTLPIRRESIQSKEVFIVDDNALVACFEQGISEALIHELAALNPLRAVFRDNGFASDAVKVNVTQIFKQRSPITEVKAL